MPLVHPSRRCRQSRLRSGFRRRRSSWIEATRSLFHCRNPFPPGGVYEDPATGAAAAAFGGYLREMRLIDTPATVTIHQGDDMGRPGLLTVDIPTELGRGISV